MSSIKKIRIVIDSKHMIVESYFVHNIHKSLNIRHLVRLICYADGFQLLVLKATTYRQLKDVVHLALRRRGAV